MQVAIALFGYLVLPISLASLCLAAPPVPASGPATQPAVNVSGITLKLEPGTIDIRSGESLRVTATIANRSNATVYLTYLDDDATLGVSATRVDGAPVRRSDLVEHLENPAGLRRNSSHRLTLLPGQEIGYGVTVTACFDLTRPGLYEIRAGNVAHIEGVPGGVPLQDAITVKVGPPGNRYGNPAGIPSGR